MKLSKETVATVNLKETLAYDSETDQRIDFQFDFVINKFEFIYSVKKIGKVVQCTSLDLAINLWNDEA